MPNEWRKAVSGEDDSAKDAADNARKMQDLSDKAGQAGWNALMEAVERIGTEIGLGEHQMVGAAITAASKLYSVMLENIAAEPMFNQKHAKLVSGMFDTLVAEQIKAVRKKAKA